MEIPHRLVNGPPRRVLAGYFYSRDGGWRISKASWGEVPHQPANSLRAACDSPPELDTKDKTDAYPSWAPLRIDEIQRAHCHRPRSAESGEYLRRYVPTRDGCRNPEPSRARWKREVIKLRCLHTPIRMRHDRMGGSNLRRKSPPPTLTGTSRGYGCRWLNRTANMPRKPLP